MASLAELINRISEERRLRRNSIQRRLFVDELKRYCEVKDYDFFPVLIEDAPEFSKPVEEYIRSMASDSLPDAHPVPKLPRHDLRNYLEVGGILEYNSATGALSELVYHCPVCEDEKIYDNSLDLIADMAELGKIRPKSANDTIGWHSQHFGIGELTTGDLDNVKEMLANEKSWPYYHIIYLPKDDVFCWYGFERVPEMPKPHKRDDWIVFSRK